MVFLNSMYKIAQVNIKTTYGSWWGSTKGFGDFVSVVLSNAVAIAGIIMFILILVGGIGVIKGAGSNDPQSVEKGKKTLTAAIIGFAVVFTSYWIMLIIERITGLQILNSPL